MRDWTNIYKNRIRAGQRLLIYVPSSKYSYYDEFNKLDFAAKQKRKGIVVNTDKTTEKTDTQSDTSGKYLYYTLKKGDTLWEIAKKYEGVTDRDLLRINGLTDGKSLKPGQQIKIKRLD